MFKPYKLYKPRVRGGKRISHEMHESFEEHLEKTVGIPKSMKPPRPKRR